MHVHVPKVGCCVHGVHGLLRVVLLCVRCCLITSRQAKPGGPHIQATTTQGARHH